MKLNKKKCGILFYNEARTQLAEWEKKKKHICEIPIVETYKYLGIDLNKKLTFKSYLDRLS